MTKRALVLCSVSSWSVVVSSGCGSTSLRPDAGAEDAGATMALAASVAAGNHHALVIKEDLSVWGWGQDSEGQLGDGAQLDATAPVKVPGLSGIRGVAAGHQHTLVLKASPLLRGEA
jgi:alpha-tubulin suppressor-like RCC1 family protein